MAAADFAGDMRRDLLVCGGGGVLGRLIIQKWKDEFPQARIVAQTKSTNNHDELQSTLGCETRVTPGAIVTSNQEKFPFVVFCAPPSKTDDYADEVDRAGQMWDATGTMLFTGSTGVYEDTNGEEVDEDGDVKSVKKAEEQGVELPESTKKLLGAESKTLRHGGCVLRLSGLYHSWRGPHTFWMQAGESKTNPNAVVNMIHYEDAASLAVAILKGDGIDGYYRAREFVGVEDQSASRKDMMDAVARCARYEGKGCTFTGDANGSVGKIMRMKNTKEMVGDFWQPKYNKGFVAFMDDGDNDTFADAGPPENVGRGHS